MIRLPHPLFALAYGVSMLAVVVLSLVPAPEVAAPEGSDKAAHLIAYGVIAFCGGLGFRDFRRQAAAAGYAVLVGALLEFAQEAWFARNGSVWDAVANGAGAMLGLAAALFVLQVWSRRVSGKN